MSLTNVKGASQRLYIVAAVVAVVVLGGILLSGETGTLGIFSGQFGAQPGPVASQQTSSESESSDNGGTQITTTETVEVEVTTPTEHTVEISSSGFSPKTMTIAKGDTVTFVSMGGGSHWPASAIHPTHTVYPGSSINKCNTDERSEIFDACEGLSEGESFSFTFNEVGTWNYHDHLNPSNFGSITVQ